MSVDVVERMKMALAEAGYPDADVLPIGVSCSIPFTIPDIVTWRAAHVIGATSWDGRGIACFTCWKKGWPLVNRMTADERPWDCLARGEGIEDCGVDRTGPNDD